MNKIKDFNKKDIAIFIETSNYCKFNCSGCNINKTLIEENMPIKKLFKIYDFFHNKNINNITFLLGPGNFLRNNNLKYYTNIIKNYKEVFIKNNYKNILLGNISLEILDDKILNFLKENNEIIKPGIVFNPLMNKENKKIFLKNIEFLKDTLDFRNVPIFLNLSSYYFKNKNTIGIIFNVLNEILETVKLDKIESLTLVFNPNKLLIYKEEFQIDLKTQTEWYLDFWKNRFKYNNINMITYEGLLINYFLNKKFYIEPYYIDKNLKMYPIIEHIGDLILNKLSKDYEILNIDKTFDISREDFFNKLNNIKRKITINNKKKLLKDKICKNCKYLDFCSKQSIAINKEIYKDTILGQETNEYCLGHKKLNDFIINNYNKG